jgi:adenylate cyclase
MLYKLISTQGDQTFELRAGAPLVVGRALNSDIPVFDPTISRRHAEVALDDNGVHVTDLGSSNGTFLNGARIDAARLAPGDVITFGKVAFRLKEAPPSPDGPRIPTPSSDPGVQPASATIVRSVPMPAAQSGWAASLRPSGSQEVVAEEASVAEAYRTQQKLEKLVDVSKELTRAVSVDALLERIADHAAKILDIDRVSILLLDEAGELIPKISRDRYGSTLGRTVPQSIARSVVEKQHAILSDNAGEDQRFGGQSILVQRVRSAMCVPLIGKEKVHGVLYVDNVTTTHRFGDEDLGFLIAFSGIAAVAIENSQFAERIRHESIVRSNFERYFAPQLAARIATSPDATKLGGEKTPIAVLFADIRGFTSLSETMSPDEIAQLLTEFFTEMVECVFRHGGTLDKFMGDMVMAQWGAPITERDDADRAMRAAIDMMEQMEGLNEKWRTQGRPELQIGIGLNYGEAFAGNIGSERRLEFTVIGDTVNTAHRLCSAADGGEILISDGMRRALSKSPKLRERPAIEVKGKTGKLAVYSVVR